MKLNPESLARASSRHPGRTVVIWLLILVAGVASAATLLGPALTTDFDFTNNPEAKRAQSILEERKLTQDIVTETFVVAGDSAGAIQDPGFTERVNVCSAHCQTWSRCDQSAPTQFPLRRRPPPTRCLPLSAPSPDDGRRSFHRGPCRRCG
jgi:hypothetical protein